MSSFLFDDLSAAENREDRMADAKRHNLRSQIKDNNISLSLYRSLANLGVRIENLGTKIESHYNCLVVREKKNILANAAK